MSDALVQSATIQLKAQAGGGFGSVPSGNSESGGDATFGWVAPTGLSNGNDLIVSSDTLTFEAPDKQVYIGHGVGWLYESADGTDFTTITVGAESVAYEGSTYPTARRKVKTIGSQKYLTSRLYDQGADNNDYNAGFIAWDTGAEISNSDTAFQFARVRCSISVVPTADLQWKQDRIRGSQYLSGESANHVYITETGEPSATWQRVNAYTSNTAATGFSTPSPIHDGVFSSFAYTWNPNTPDMSNGSMASRNLRAGGVGFGLSVPETGGGAFPDDIVKSAWAARPQWIQRQDYIGNNVNSARDIDIDVTDIYWKVNGDLFLLANNSDLDLCTEEPVPLIPTSISGDGKSITLNLWLGSMTSYAGKFIVRLDRNMNVLNTVGL